MHTVLQSSFQLYVFGVYLDGLVAQLFYFLGQDLVYFGAAGDGYTINGGHEGVKVQFLLYNAPI